MSAKVSSATPSCQSLAPGAKSPCPEGSTRNYSQSRARSSSSTKCVLARAQHSPKSGTMLWRRLQDIAFKIQAQLEGLAKTGHQKSLTKLTSTCMCTGWSLSCHSSSADLFSAQISWPTTSDGAASSEEAFASDTAGPLQRPASARYLTCRSVA